MNLRLVLAVLAMPVLSACAGNMMTRSPESTQPPPGTVPAESGQLRIARDSETEFIGPVYDNVTLNPVLIGDWGEIMSRINYPVEARRARVEGRVHLRFVVDTEGQVRNARVAQGIGGGCDQEALRVIRSARFEPGRLNGEIVNTSMTMSFSFTLR